MKMRIGMLRDTNRSDMTALSFGVASAPRSNWNLRDRLVPTRLMTR
jgi:hypothetical protein